MNRSEALQHAVRAHAGETDRCGNEAVLHPIAVAEAVEQLEAPVENYVVVALLHDVIEDTNYSLPWGDLSTSQAGALRYLTRNPEKETYADYVAAICRSEFKVPQIVKLADLWHNLSPQRQDCLPAEEAKSLQARYLKARDRIWGALGYEWWPEPIGDRSEEGSG